MTEMTVERFFELTDESEKVVYRDITLIDRREKREKELKLIRKELKHIEFDKPFSVARIGRRLDIDANIVMDELKLWCNQNNIKYVSLGNKGSMICAR